jgi:predicted O-linked N-acetylglucosamine transferase (SPINDLY family)
MLAVLAALPRVSFAVAIASIGGAAFPAGDGADSLALPAQPDATTAKAIGAGDFDVLIDFAGLAAATGPLLAQRPARRIWTVAELPMPNAAPLVDRVFDGTEGLVAALSAAHASLDPRNECALDPTQMAAAWTEAVRTHQRGDRARACQFYERVLALQPGYVPGEYLRGIAMRDAGDSEAAQAAFAAALARAPDYIDARLAAARLAIDAGDPGVAIALCDAGLARAGGDARLLRVAGLAQLARRDGAAAAAAFEAALLQDGTHGETHYNHGVALQMQRDFDEAARAYQRALACQPDLVAANFNLGVLFQEQGATAAAVAAYKAALSADPQNATAYKNLGEVLHGAGRVDEWIANFRRFEAACPRALPLAVQALEVCQFVGDFARLERYLTGLADERFEASDEGEVVDCLEELLYLLLFFDVPPETLRRFAQTYDLIARRVYGEPLPFARPRVPGRLRVGYLSADLRNQVMGKMIWSALQHHDKGRFEIFVYSLSAVSDEWTQKFRGLADRFETIAGLPERAAAQRIADDDLDLLVDLSTHTKGARPGILALKPARVQITHVASAGTVGLSTIDFKLTDRYADVPENQASQCETLLPMDGCVYPYRHITPAATHPFRREAFGIAPDAVVIGAFVHWRKLSRRCLALWRDVLARIPRATLAFSPLDPAARGSYLRLTAAAGIAADRLHFLPQGRTEAENQSRFELVDFALDPMPFGGVNGTLEALDMAVPVVTLCGGRHGERSSFSILANLGVTQTVASSGPQYVALAARLADDAAFASEVRAAIRAGLARSPLTDMVRHTRALEAAYETALAQKRPDVLVAAATG